MEVGQRSHRALRRSSPLGFAALALLSFACGAPDLANEEDIRTPPQSSAGGSGSAGQSGAGGQSGLGGAGAAGAAGAGAFGCAADEAVFYGAPVDATNACLDTAALVPLGCGRPEEQTGERCLRRLADGARFWSMLDGVPRFDATLWESCASGLGAPEPTPPLCLTRACAVPAPAFCAPAAMVAALSCGSPIGEWDESCCQRPSCATADDCALDQDCRAVTIVFRQCWPQGDAQSCDCAGLLTFAEELRCVPTPSG